MRILGRLGHAENFEVRMLRPDGSVGWISINVRLVRDDAGIPLYHEGTMRTSPRGKRPKRPYGRVKSSTGPQSSTPTTASPLSRAIRMFT